MRVLVKKSNNPSVNHIYGGIGRVLVKIGIQPVVWDSNVKPSFDAFDEIRPDIFMTSDHDLSLADLKCIKQNPQCLFVLHRQYPDQQNSFDLSKMGASPDVEFTSTHEGISGGKLSLPCAIDTLNRYGANKDTVLSISAICEAEEKFTRFLKGFCDCRNGANLSIFGKEFGVNQYFGPSVGNEASIYGNSFISIIFGDNKYESNFRLYECIKYGGLPLAEYNETDQIILNSSFSSFIDITDIDNWLKHYKQYPQHRQQTTELLQKACMEHHTYFNRAVKLFDALGLDDITSKIKAVK